MSQAASLHPLFEPAILDEVLRLQQEHLLAQEQQVEDAIVEPYHVERTAEDICVALDNLARCYQGLRDDIHGMQQLLIRVIDILAERA